MDANEHRDLKLTTNLLDNYYEKSLAIIIGINQYKEETCLVNAENDAKAIMNVLREKYGFTVIKSLFNEDATANQLREIFDDMLQDLDKIGPRDRVIIYYSGHGKLRLTIGRDGEEIKEGYIVPYDSKKVKYFLNISMNTVIKACQKCPAKHVLLILDCCYSGAAAVRSIGVQIPRKATQDYIKDISSRTAIQVLAAGQEDEPVSDSGIRPGYSAFTGALLDILETERDPDNNGILTASEIGYNLERQVAVQKQTGVYQRPVYTHIPGSKGGDFIFSIFDTSSQENSYSSLNRSDSVSEQSGPVKNDVKQADISQETMKGISTDRNEKSHTTNMLSHSKKNSQKGKHQLKNQNIVIAISGAITAIVIVLVVIGYMHPGPWGNIIPSKHSPPPIAINQNVVTNENIPVNVTLAGADPQNPNANLTAHIMSQPSNGRLGPIDQKTGIVTYTPKQGFIGYDRFTFKVNDGNTDSRNTANVNVTVYYLYR